MGPVNAAVVLWGSTKTWKDQLRAAIVREAASEL